MPDRRADPLTRLPPSISTLAMPSAPSRLHQGRQVDAALPAAAIQYPGTIVDERLPFRSRNVRACHHDRLGRGRLRQHTGVYRYRQACVKDNACGVATVAVRPSRGQAGVVYLDRIDADQNGIHGVPQFMHELSGLRSPLTQWASPVRVAMRPSKVAAHLRMTNGNARPYVFEEKRVLPAGGIFGQTFNNVDSGTIANRYCRRP